MKEVKRTKRKRPNRRPYTASTIVYGLDKMTRAQRGKIAKWMESRANWIRKHGDLAASRFTQRLMHF